MKLYTIYKKDDKVVYSIFAEGTTRFFFEGFASAEEAKQTTFEWHYNYKLSKLKPNSQGIFRPHGVIRAEIEMFLTGVWTEIE